MPVRVSHRAAAAPAANLVDVTGLSADAFVKIAPPVAHRVHVNRRLLDRLDAQPDRPIVWVCGPPGAGKTTLGASYLIDRDARSLWYRLDEGDADPAALFLYLGAAWRRHNTSLTLPLLTPEFRSALPLFSRRFFRALFAGRETDIVVFDDYHDVPLDSAFHQCMAAGLEEIPNGCRVVVLSRMLPPPEFARLRMNGVLDLIEPEALRVTAGEARALASTRGADVSAVSIDAMVRQTHGWTAGLILMLETGAESSKSAPETAPVPELLFDYFANEVLERLDAGTQRVVCMLSLLPAMTVEAAERLTGSDAAGALLEDLRKRNYFTTRDRTAEPRYRFHPLFRAFLQEGARKRVSESELAALQARAGAILDEDGQFDAAVALFTDGGDFDGLADLIKRRATALQEEGRHQTLVNWLAKLPIAQIEGDPWLNHWSGMARVYLAPNMALAFFKTAFTQFKVAGDVAGQFTAWGGQAEVVRVDAFGDVGRYNAMIDALYALLAEHREIPPGDVMLRVALGMAMGLSRCRNDRDEIALWQARARVAAAQVNRPGIAELVDFSFAMSDFHDANYEAALAALETLPDPLTLDHVPTTQITAVIAHGMALLFRQRTDDCAAFVEKALARLGAGGFFGWLPLLASFAVNDACRRGDRIGCKAWLRRNAAYADSIASNRGVHYHFAAARYGIMIGDLAAAKADAETAVVLAVKIGWPVFEAYARLGRAEVLVEMQDFEEAAFEIERLDAVFARSAVRMIAISIALLKAELSFAQGDEASGIVYLKAAMATGKRQGDRRAILSAVRVSRLCARALALHIEPDFVRTFIRASETPPPDPYDDAWPWALKISTFGGLAVEKDDEPLRFGRKTPKRLIMLLKAIVAFGGRDVPEDKLIDALWPDEEGDAAAGSLKVAIHRLRQLLGDADAIIVKNGRVGLDPTRCWLDIWSFDRKLASRDPHETEASFRQRIAQARALYRGDFLEGDDDLWWATRPREAMRARYTRTGGQAALSVPDP